MLRTAFNRWATHSDPTEDYEANLKKPKEIQLCSETLKKKVDDYRAVEEAKEKVISFATQQV